MQQVADGCAILFPLGAPLQSGILTGAHQTFVAILSKGSGRAHRECHKKSSALNCSLFYQSKAQLLSNIFLNWLQIFPDRFLQWSLFSQPITQNSTVYIHLKSYST